METIKFTKSELNHLANLIADNERDGTYYGNRKQYWKRSFELKQKLLLFAVSSYCPQCGVEHSTTAYIGFCSDKCLNKYQGNMTANVDGMKSVGMRCSDMSKYHNVCNGLKCSNNHGCPTVLYRVLPAGVCTNLLIFLILRYEND